MKQVEAYPCVYVGTQVGWGGSGYDSCDVLLTVRGYMSAVVEKGTHSAVESATEPLKIVEVLYQDI